MSPLANSKSYLKRSRFILGLAKAVRGLVTDVRVLGWLVQRNRKIELYVRAHLVKKLQIGTSNNMIDGWLNTDILPNHGSIVHLDATRRFPFEDDTFDYIMAEHMIEHIDYQSAMAMLRECFRVLKPGGRVRFATPDLAVVLALHSKERTPAATNYIDWAITRLMPEVQECKEVFVINNMFRAWGHLFLYDEPTLRHALLRSGFRALSFCKPGISADPNLKNLEFHGKEIESEEMNQFETIVVEGSKER